MRNKSSRDKHSFIQFYFDDWMAGTARMSRLARSIYFDICLYNWDKRRPVPPSTLMIMLADVENAPLLIEAMLEDDVLVANDKGAIHSPRAIREGERAYAAWEAKSRGGRNRGNSGDEISSGASELQESSEQSSEDSSKSGATEPDSDSDTDSEEGKSPVLGVVDVAEAWNEMAGRSGLSQVKLMTTERLKRLGARVEEHGAQAIIDGINSIPEVPFLMGEGERGYKANFDFLLVPKNCAKLLEGGYKPGRGKPSGWTGD